MIELSKQFKHEMAKAFAHAILSRSGNNLIPCSMERHIREVTALDLTTYKSMNMPQILRILPDYFVLDRSTMARELVDIAYRTTIDDRLKADLEAKLSLLKEMVLILFYGGSKKLGDKQDFFEVVRCCQLEWHGEEPLIHLREKITGFMQAVPLRNTNGDTIWHGMVPLNWMFSKVDLVEPGLEAAVETAARAFAA